MLGLLVGEGGLPIGYDIFEGNTFEGHTLLPTLRKIQEKYGFKQPIVVADAAMLSEENIEKLERARYPFIIGARIKNESEQMKRTILKKSVGIKDHEHYTLPDSSEHRSLTLNMDDEQQILYKCVHGK